MVLALQPNLSGAVANGNEDVVWRCGNQANVGTVHQPAAGAAAPTSVGPTTVLNKYLPAACRP